MFKIIVFCVIAHLAIGLPHSPKKVPLNPEELAKRARYILHIADWVSMASISVDNAIKGSPFVSIKSMSDGPVSNSSGIPYFYMTDLDVTAKDLLEDNRCTILASLLQTGYCQTNDLDPQAPECAKLFITGKYVKVTNPSDEHEFAGKGLFERHPVMKFWPKDHGFNICKLEIEKIRLLDGSTHVNGGVVEIPIPMYLQANDFENIKF